MSDHPRIWLQSAADAKLQDEGRMWCQDKVWPDDPYDGDPTEYVRADLYASLETRIARLTAAMEEVRGHFIVERDAGTRTPSIGYDSNALPKIIAILDAARSLSDGDA